MIGPAETKKETIADLDLQGERMDPENPEDPNHDREQAQQGSTSDSENPLRCRTHRSAYSSQYAYHGFPLCKS